MKSNINLNLYKVTSRPNHLLQLYSSSHLSGDVISVVNQILEAVSLCIANGTNGDRRLYPGGLPISLFSPQSYLHNINLNASKTMAGLTEVQIFNCILKINTRFPIYVTDVFKNKSVSSHVCVAIPTLSFRRTSHHLCYNLYPEMPPLFIFPSIITHRRGVTFYYYCQNRCI